MELFLSSKRKGFCAKAIFDTESNNFVVLKGATVSENVARSEKFRGAKYIEKAREKYVVDGHVMEDVVFNSPSTAANFTTGRSTNGLITWKDKDGVKLKELLADLTKN